MRTVKTEVLLRDPVFQLNLLIWMAKEQPSTGYRVRPLFFEMEFRLVYIEQPFAFPDATARALESSSLAIVKAPEPEMILGRSRDQKALYFEAKANSFGHTSDNSKQARGHLVACGPAFAEVLRPLEKALLCYVVPQDRCAPMADCLTSLTAELRSQTLSPGEHSVHGLAVNGQDLVYSWDGKFKQHCGIVENSAAVLHELQDETDPRPLLLVFTDEDCPSEEQSGYYRRVLLNQVVAKLVCDLNLLRPEQTYATTARELLRQTTDRILDYVGRERQNSMIRIVRQNVFARIFNFWRERQFSPVKLEADRLEIAFKDNLAKAEFMGWLEAPERTAFTDLLPPKEHPLLPGIEPSQEGRN
jgi:hypothetical protein